MTENPHPLDPATADEYLTAEQLLDNPADATLREDVVTPCAVAGDILQQAPDPEAPYFRVPKVIER